QMLAWDAARRDDMKDLEGWLDASIERYESSRRPNSAARRMKQFIPLSAALKDPSHKDRGKALDYFTQDTEWAVMQWFLIKTYKLSKDDAIHFLGGDGTDLIRQALVLYLKQDKERFRETFEKLKNQDSFAKSRFALITHLRNDLLEVPVPK